MPTADTPAGTNAGTNADANPGDSEFVTKKDLEELVSRVANAAVSSQLKRSMNTVNATIASTIKEALIAAKTDAQEGEGEGIVGTAGTTGVNANGDPKTKPEPKPGPSEEVVALTRKLEALEKAREKDQRTALAERKRANEAKAYGDLRAMLGGKVVPDSVDHVVNMLRGAGRIAIDDDGNVKMRVRAAPEKGLPIEDLELPLDEAMPHFISSAEAKFYLPPPSASQSKTRTLLPQIKPPPTGHSDASAKPADALKAAFEAEHGPLRDHL